MRMRHLRTTLPWLLLATITVAALAYDHFAGWWLFDREGQPLLRDFVSQWAAGRRAATGEATLIYDWVQHPAYQATLMGEAEPVPLFMVYPPFFLFFVLPFAPFGYVAASVLMLALTLACYAAALNRVTRAPALALLVALSGGGAFYAIFWVQNSLLVAALLVGGLVALPRRPILAGILFGLLTIKPQMGLLLPLVLLIDRRWRVILAAIVTVLLLAILSEATFGPGIWTAFLQSIGQSPKFLDFPRLSNMWQSVFGLIRLGFGDRAGWLAHGVVALGVAWIVGSLWARDLPWRIKSAALIAGSLLMSPYLFVYDAVPLSAAALFLWSEKRGPAMSASESLLMFGACLLPMASNTLWNAAVPLAAMIMLCLAVRRAERVDSSSRQEDRLPALALSGAARGVTAPDGPANRPRHGPALFPSRHGCHLGAREPLQDLVGHRGLRRRGDGRDRDDSG